MSSFEKNEKIERKEVLIIGGGPAGLSAGIYAGYFGIEALILEKGILGGVAGEIPLLENYPGIESKITGRDLIERMVRRCDEVGVERHQFEEVVKLQLKDTPKVVETDKSKYLADNVIIASGRAHRTLGVVGEEAFKGRGVSYCAVCDGAFFKNRKVTVIGESFPVVEVALYFSNLASEVVLVYLGSKIDIEKSLITRLEEKKVKLLKNVEVKEIKGEVKVRSVVVGDKKTHVTKEIDTDGVFFQVEGIPQSRLAKEAGVRVDKEEYVIIDEKMRTNIKGVYAIGDVTSCEVKRIITGVAQALVAITDIFREKAGYVTK